MFKDAFIYWKEFGFLALLKKIPMKLCELIGLCERNEASDPELNNSEFITSPESVNTAETEDVINAVDNYLKPIRIYTSPGRIPLVTLVAGQVGKAESNVDAAILFAIMLANNRNYGLRIISSPEINKNHFHDLLKSSDIPFQKNVDFLPLYPQIHGREIDITYDDVFLTTSWQTTHMVIESIDEGKVVYLIQEDERKLLATDDDSDMCVALLRNRNINFVIQSKSLYQALISEGFENIRERGGWFEADSPQDIFSRGNSVLPGVNRVFAGVDSIAGRKRSRVSS